MAEYLQAIGIYYPNELRSIHKSSEKLQPIYEAFTNAWESVQEKIKLYLEYVEKHNFFYDLGLIFKTFWVIVKER